MDGIMSNERIANTEAANDPHGPVADDREKAVKPEKPSDDAKLESLSVDDSDNFGGDPYNHTGSYCVPKFDA